MPEPFDLNDYAGLLVYSALHYRDWQQTKTLIVERGQKEINPILGEHPTGAQVDAYFAATLVGVAATAYVLPDKWRKTLLGAGIGLELYITEKNKQFGLKSSF